MNKKVKALYIFFLLISAFMLVPNTSYAQRNEQVKIDSILILIAQAKEDTNKVNLYYELMSNHVYYNQEEGLKYEIPAQKLAEKLNWQPGIYKVKQISGKIYWRLNKFDEALKNHFTALSIAEKLNDKKLIAATMGAIGQDYGDQSNYPEALKYFKKALAISLETGDMNRAALMYNLLSWVYEQQGNYPESIKTNFEVLKISQKLGDIDLETVTMSNIGDSYRLLGNDSMALEYLNNSIAKREKKHTLSITDKISFIHSYISIGSIHQKNKDYPQAFKEYDLALKIAKEIKDFQTITSSYNHMGKLIVTQGNDAEAISLFLLAVESSKSLQDYKVAAELCYSIGGCYTRLKKYEEANRYYEKARLMSEKMENESLSYLYYEGVEIIDSATGNWKDAYMNYKNSVRLKNELHNEENTKKIMQTIMQSEFDKKEAATKAEQEKKDIRQRTIRNAIAASLGVSLLFLIVVYQQRNKISKARRRSDELLLNILPGDVAEELKEKGSADAKLFDEVTVMFTDFKNFTQISEKLTPTELVAEIHTCFQAFDNIIGKHNIEKIKTIGDSYMCSGGLPIANNTHAEDVVKAALEIQQFMMKHLQQRKNEGKEIFEIRIGIHTGPVVAGIVGVKKFAYDIWGDTVNIASRMESSGEAGKVNISGSTYAQVKDKFKCIHRGKIQAKNKGEVDMYFVEGLI